MTYVRALYTLSERWSAVRTSTYYLNVMPSSVNTVMSDCIHALVVLLLYGLHDNAFKNHRYTLSKEKIVLDFFCVDFLAWLGLLKHTDGSRILHTLLVKHFNDLLDGQKSQRTIDKVTYFYVGDLFCIHLGTKYANFQEKIFADISGRKLQTLCIT